MIVTKPIAPPGWVLVPIEPTEAMTGAAEQACDGLTVASEVWRLMVGAAPGADSSEQG